MLKASLALLLSLFLISCGGSSSKKTESTEHTPCGNLYTIVDYPEPYIGYRMTVYFSENFTSGNFYLPVSDSYSYEAYDFEFNGTNEGYVMPTYELNYLQGALGID